MSIKRSLAVGLSITGTIVGVGFASGEEIVSFFTRHGALSFLFCFLAGGLFAFMSYLVFCVSSYDNTRNNKVKIFDKFFNALLLVCQIAIASAMFAGFDLIFEMLDLSVILKKVLKASIFIFILGFLLIKRDGAYVANSILSALMFVSIIFLFVAMLSKGITSGGDKIFESELLYFPMLYVGMNIFTAYPLLRETGEFMKTRKERVTASVFIGVFVTLSLLLINFIAHFSGIDLDGAEMIMVSVSFGVSPIMGYVYIVLLSLCILTTLISTIYGATKCVNNKKNFFALLLGCETLAFALSYVGFSKIIDVVYPVIGFVCLVVVFAKVLLFRCKMSKYDYTKSERWVKKKRKTNTVYMKKVH